MTNWEELKWRGLIKDTAGDDIEDKINNGEITFYLGTDPTADSNIVRKNHYRNNTCNNSKRLPPLL